MPGFLIGQPAPPNGFSSGWTDYPLGAGGYCTGIDIHSDGTTVIRNDTMGGHVWSDSADKWIPLVTRLSMAGLFTEGQASGIYEIRIAPSNSSIFYMFWYTNVYKSTNKGATWAITAYPTTSGSDNPNDVPRKGYGEKIAINPSDPNHVIVGFPGVACRQSFNGGTSWSNLPTVGVAADSSGGYRIVFRSATEIIVMSAGNGTYRSTDTGISFSLMSGGPSMLRHMTLAPDGTIYGGVGSGAAVFWKLLGTTWSSPAAPGVPDGIATNPSDANKLIMWNEQGGFWTSPDKGANWTALSSGFSYVSGDVGWHYPFIAPTGGQSSESWTIGNVVVHPSIDKLVVARGIGVWEIAPKIPNTGVLLYTKSRGIEQLISNGITFPDSPNGRLISWYWDRPFFITDYPLSPTTYPARYGPRKGPVGHSIQMGWGADWASSNPDVIMGLSIYSEEQSGYTTDFGTSDWTIPAGHYLGNNPADPNSWRWGGCVAAASPSNWIMVQSNQGDPFVTTNTGATFTKIVIAGVPQGNGVVETGWGWAYYFKREIVAADRVNIGTFYLYNYLTGLYKSTDNGSTWTLVHSGQIGIFTGFHAKLKSVPRNAGHIVFTAGRDQGQPLYYSKDARATPFATIPNVTGVIDIGFGMPGNGKTYPMVFIAGYLSGVFGIYMTENFDAASPTWVTLPSMLSFDVVTGIAGDFRRRGVCYVQRGNSSLEVYNP